MCTCSWVRAYVCMCVCVCVRGPVFSYLGQEVDILGAIEGGESWVSYVGAGPQDGRI